VILITRHLFIFSFNMKKFITNIFCFFIILLFIAIMIDYRLEKNINTHSELQYIETTNPNKNADFIILGTSLAAHGIRPEILDSIGIKSYNFSLNGSNPQFYINWYKNIFSKYYKKPKYCLIEVAWFLFDDNRLWRRYEQDSEYFPYNVYISNLLDFERYNSIQLILNRYPFVKHKYIKDLKYLFMKKDDFPFVMTKFNDGFVPYEPNKSKIEKKSFKHKSNRVNQKYFEELINILLNDGIKLIFISVPEYGTKEDYQKLKEFDIFNKIARKHSIPFFNYNIEKRTFINDKKKFYSDLQHLNSNGSIEFSKILKEDLKIYLRTTAEARYRDMERLHNCAAGRVWN